MEKRIDPIDPVRGISEEELKKEADTVREMMDQFPELQNVEVPEELHLKLADRIRQYEEDKVLENLSEKDQEALRLGRKLQEESAKKKVVYRPKKRKVWFALAAILVIVLGVGLTSVGGKKIIVDVFQKNFGDSEKTYVDTEELTLPTTEESMSEDEAYAEIEKVFGTKIVYMGERPSKTKFLELQLDEVIQEATLYYSIGEEIFSFRVEFPYSESSHGMEIQDELIHEYVMELPETDVFISEYKIQDTGEKAYTASFMFKDNKYFLQGIIKQEDFEKIIKNLNFF